MGAHLVVTGRDGERAEDVAREVRAAGGKSVKVFVADLSSQSQVRQIADDYLAAEIVYSVTHEGARHLDDVLTRRTRASIETFDRGVAAAPGVARLMGGELGWDEARQRDEVDHYLRRVEAERLSQEQLSDREADEARVKAPDIV